MSRFFRNGWLVIVGMAFVLPAIGQAQGAPRLPNDMAEEVAQQEELIDAALWQEAVDQARLRELIQLAERILDIRRKKQGQRWWETIDAKWRLQDLRQRLHFDALQRANLLELQTLSTRVADLYNEGRYDEAIASARQESNARRMLLREEHPSYAASAENLAVLYETVRRFEEAEPFHRDALTIRKAALGEAHPLYAQSLHNLGALHVSMGRHQKAVPYYRQALAIKEQALGEGHPDYAKTLHSLAAVYGHMRRYQEAKVLLKEALATWRALGADHPAYATSLGNMVMLYAAMGRRAKVADLARRAVDARWRSLTWNFAALSKPQKQQLLADQGALVATDVLWSLVFDEKGVDPEAGLHVALLMKQLLFEAARQESAALRKVLAAASPKWRAYFEELQQLRRRYAALALKSMTDAGELEQDEGRSEALESAQELAERIERIEQYVRDRSRSTNPGYAKLLRLKRIGIAQVRAALRPGDALLEYVHYRRYDSDAQDWGSRRYGVFVLRRAGVVVAVDLGEAEAIDDAVRDFRNEAEAAIERGKSVALGRGDERALAGFSEKLRALAWEPLQEHLTDVRRVYVAPDGELGLIPFEALATKDADGGRRYLVEDYELVYVGTARDLGRLAMTAKPQRKTRGTAVLIGNPALEARPQDLAKVVARLEPATGRTSVARAHSISEGARVDGPASGEGHPAQTSCEWVPYASLEKLVVGAGKQLEGLGWSVPPVLLDEQAVEEAVYGLKGPRILQFATHGQLAASPGQEAVGWDNPLLRSTLLLAGVCAWRQEISVYYRVGEDVLSEAQARERGLSEEQLREGRIDLADGRLTGYEVTGLDLDGTDLVNMTACETGLGEVKADGVVGLRQAFLLAGARSLTMSMWEVPADETPQQIEEFYDRWLGGKGNEGTTRYKAFRAAQLQALQRARDSATGGHPFYWAGVVFVGDPGDLPAAMK